MWDHFSSDLQQKRVFFFSTQVYLIYGNGLIAKRVFALWTNMEQELMFVTKKQFQNKK